MLEYGAKLSNIIKLRGRSMKRLVVIFDGEKYEPIFCDNINIKLENDEVILELKTSESVQTDNSIPSEQVMIAPSKDETFILTGDDYSSFIALSEFRRTENITEKKEGQKLEAFTIESETYDIQDMQSVSNAILGVISKEQEYLKKDYKVFKTSDPRYIYEDDNLFKLVETVVLCKEKDVAIKEINNS